MKLIFLLLTITAVHVSANTFAQKISINEKNASLEKIFNRIKSQTDYDFFFDKSLLNKAKPVTINVKGATIEETLKNCFINQPFTYTIEERTIVVVPRKAETLTNLSVGEMQQKIITGKVTDEQGEILPGVSIRVKNTQASTISDAKGNYKINIQSGNDILIFSYLGFATQEINVGNNQTVNVKLIEEVSKLDKIVVVGYGEQKRINVTGSIASIDFKELENTPQANTINILSGRLPGVSVVQPGGQPGSDEGEILIRGTGTLNDSSPLVIIDGAMASISDLGNLTPQEIENISVLKDASSTAIYGARGANGVVLVTTKMPKNKKMQIGYNAYYGTQQATYLPKSVESWQWMELMNIATGQTNYPNWAIENVKNGILTDTFNNVKWYDHVFRTAPMVNHNISVSGGDQQTLAFQGNIGYLNQDGIMYGTSSKRYNYRANVRGRISSNVTVGLTTWGFFQQTHEPGSAPKTIMDYINRALPITPVHYSNGNWGVYKPSIPDGTDGARVVNNPLLFTEIGRRDADFQKSNLQGYFDYKPLRGLQLRTSLSYNTGTKVTEAFMPTYSYNALDDKPALFNNRSSLENRNDNTSQLQVQTTANYSPKVGNGHTIKLLLGHEYTRFNSGFFSASGYDLPDNDLQVLNLAVSDFTVGGDKQSWKLQSFFGRVNYSWKDKYLLEGNLRIDGSSRFSENKKYGYFPSFSAGWILSKENFFKRLTSSKGLNFVKFRGGWGQVGNDRIGNYSFMQYIDLTNMYTIGGQYVAGAAISAYGNDRLKWETTTTTNFGVDLGLFDNKLSITADWFNRLTDNILYQLPNPPSFGIVTPSVQNIAAVSNKGWELNVDYKNHIGKFNYKLGLNGAYVKNKIEELYGREAVDGRFILREGEAINSFYGYVMDGIFRTQDDLNTYPKYNANTKIGSMRFKDVVPDGVINDNDRAVLGTANTPYTYGITGGFSFKGFDMNFLFQGVKGKSVYIYDYGNRPGNAGDSNYWTEWYTNRFDPVTNPDGTWPAVMRSNPEAVAPSSFWVHDASYLRLKNVELGYAMPAAVLKHIKFSSVRFYVSGQNLLTFTNLIKQIDPERSRAVTGNTSYPQTKVITFGINTTL